MKKESDEKLCKDFPKIFRQRGLPMTETCMCWGFECGDGWFHLIYKLCEDIQKHCDKNPDTQVEATQVKEKFGGLRFYTNFGDQVIYDLIDKAEEKSYKICETCGSTEEITQTKGWISTICKACLDEKEGVVRGYN